MRETLSPTLALIFQSSKKTNYYYFFGDGWQNGFVVNNIQKWSIQYPNKLSTDEKDLKFEIFYIKFEC